MRVGLSCNRFDWMEQRGGIGPALADLARRAEAAGFASVWVMDHVFQVPRHGAIDEPVPEACATLAYVAG